MDGADLAVLLGAFLARRRCIAVRSALGAAGRMRVVVVKSQGWRRRVRFASAVAPIVLLVGCAGGDGDAGSTLAQGVAPPESTMTTLDGGGGRDTTTSTAPSSVPTTPPSSTAVVPAPTTSTIPTTTVPPTTVPSHPPLRLLVGDEAGVMRYDGGEVSRVYVGEVVDFADDRGGGILIEAPWDDRRIYGVAPGSNRRAEVVSTDRGNQVDLVGVQPDGDILYVLDDYTSGFDGGLSINRFDREDGTSQRISWLASFEGGATVNPSTGTHVAGIAFEGVSLGYYTLDLTTAQFDSAFVEEYYSGCTPEERGQAKCLSIAAIARDGDSIVAAGPGGWLDSGPVEGFWIIRIDPTGGFETLHQDPAARDWQVEAIFEQDGRIVVSRSRGPAVVVEPDGTVRELEVSGIVRPSH